MEEVKNESVLVEVVKESLEKEPTDEERIVSCFSFTDQPLATLLVSAYIDQKRDLQVLRETLQSVQEKQDMTYELLLSSQKKRITAVNLSRFFLCHRELLNNFSWNENFICVNGKKITKESKELIELSIKLEDYFGCIDIKFEEILIAIKRYFFKLEQLDNLTRDRVAFLCQDYLSKSRTKTRTRVPMKYLRSLLDLPLSEIKEIMASLEYQEIKDIAGNLHYIPPKKKQKKNY